MLVHSTDNNGTQRRSGLPEIGHFAVFSGQTILLEVEVFAGVASATESHAARWSAAVLC